MKSQTAFTSAFLAALAAGAKGFNALFAPKDGFRGPTPAKRGAKKDAGAYGKGLVAHWNKKRREVMPKVGVLRDAHGAYTHVGRPPNLDGAGNVNGRRKWLAGISAQRGY